MRAMNKAKILRKKYPEFVFKSFDWRLSKNDLEVSFNFSMAPDIVFKPKLTVKNISRRGLESIGKQSLDNLIFHLGLIESLSYWKAACSPKIKIEAGELDLKQKKWWRKLIIKGLSQFFYENKIDFRKPGFLQITTSRKKPPKIAGRQQGLDADKLLVGIGGGKDSALSLEILKKTKKKPICFSLNPNPPARKIAKIGGCQKLIVVKREIDPKLLTLNQKGFLNGHTPFSAYLAFLSVLLAEIYKLKSIVFANERSANEGNLEYLGKSVNHQYSKTFAFETDFRNYSKTYLDRNIEYFSLLRPLYEIQIAKLFSRQPKYFSSFLSCNQAFKAGPRAKQPAGKWCGRCPKCLFVFSSLYPFLKEKRLIEVFGSNLFENKELLPLAKRLIGKQGVKPFECVGTIKESQSAFYLSLKKAKEKKKLPYLLRSLEKEFLPKQELMEKQTKAIAKSWNKRHYLPKSLEKILKSVLREKSWKKL
jgi:hypothetical protein